MFYYERCHLETWGIGVVVEECQGLDRCQAYSGPGKNTSVDGKELRMCEWERGQDELKQGYGKRQMSQGHLDFANEFGFSPVQNWKLLEE